MRQNYVIDDGHNKRAGYTENETDNAIIYALNVAEYESLETVNKTVFGAINELINKFGGYYTKQETNNAIDNAIVDALSVSEYESLETTNKTIIGAINEINGNFSNYYTKKQVDEIIDSLLPIDTAAGSIANFDTNLSRPLVELTADVVATETGNGDKSPSNPYVLNGISDLNIFTRGSNFFNISTKTNDKALVWSTGNTYNDNKSIVSDFIEVKEGVKFTSNYYAQWCCYDKNKNYLGNIFQNALITSSGSDRKDNTIPSGYGICFLKLGYRSSQNNNEDMTQKTNIVLSLGNTALTFEAYKGTTTIINLGGTYYGGHFTQAADGSRAFEVTFGLFDYLNANFLRSNSSGQWANYIFYAQVEGMKNAAVIESDIYQVMQSGQIGNMDNYKCKTGSSNNYIYIRNDDYTDAQSFKAAMANSKLIYQLETPYIINLPDGDPINTFIGINNIFADSGKVSVKFKDTIQNYIDKKTT